MQQPRQCKGHRCDIETAGDSVQFVGLKRRKPTQREIGYIGDTLCSKGVDQGIIGAVGKVVQVLHAHNRRDSLGSGDLLGAYGAKTELFDQPFLLKLCEYREWTGDRSRSGAAERSDAQVDDI